MDVAGQRRDTAYLHGVHHRRVRLVLLWGRSGIPRTEITLDSVSGRYFGTANTRFELGGSLAPRFEGRLATKESGYDADRRDSGNAGIK